jgi:hypothetical protein
METRSWVRRTVCLYVIGIASFILMMLAKKYLPAQQYRLYGAVIALATWAIISVPDIIGLFTRDDWILRVGPGSEQYLRNTNISLYHKVLIARALSIILFARAYAFAFDIDAVLRLPCVIAVSGIFRISAFFQGLYAFYKSALSRDFERDMVGRVLDDAGINRVIHGFISTFMFLFFVTFLMFLPQSIRLTLDEHEYQAAVLTAAVLSCVMFFIIVQRFIIWLTLKYHRMLVDAVSISKYLFYLRNTSAALSAIVFIGSVSLMN